MTEVFDQRLAELKQRFLTRAAGDSIILAKFASELDRSAQAALPTTDIRRIAHWLAGAGGTFGFTRISACATALEALVSNLPDSDRLGRACRAVIMVIHQEIQQDERTDG